MLVRLMGLHCCAAAPLAVSWPLLVLVLVLLAAAVLLLGAPTRP
jgi:hypothetical protein